MYLSHTSRRKVYKLANSGTSACNPPPRQTATWVHSGLPSNFPGAPTPSFLPLAGTWHFACAPALCVLPVSWSLDTTTTTNQEGVSPFSFLSPLPSSTLLRQPHLPFNSAPLRTTTSTNPDSSISICCPFRFLELSLARRFLSFSPFASPPFSRPHEEKASGQVNANPNANLPHDSVDLNNPPDNNPRPRTIIPKSHLLFL
ncbi:hypothetical protein GE09DRAFT_1099387 [Coniochaeta sp. 2T2.1]|nr:hypothetical protein GE09DRAFT_1099387 [Coniochaeta sp. 2T2.1]